MDGQQFLVENARRKASVDALVVEQLKEIFLFAAPPLAMMGTSGNCFRIFATTRGVSVLQATFRMDAPESMRLRMFGVLFCHCDDDRDVHHPRDRQQVQVRDGGIEHHAHGTLALHVAGKVQGAHAVGGAARPHRRTPGM